MCARRLKCEWNLGDFYIRRGQAMIALLLGLACLGKLAGITLTRMHDLTTVVCVKNRCKMSMKKL